MKAFFDYKQWRFVNYIAGHYVVTNEPNLYDPDDDWNPEDLKEDPDHDYSDVRLIDVEIVPKDLSDRKIYEDTQLIEDRI